MWASALNAENNHGNQIRRQIKNRNFQWKVVLVETLWLELSAAILRQWPKWAAWCRHYRVILSTSSMLESCERFRPNVISWCGVSVEITNTLNHRRQQYLVHIGCRKLGNVAFAHPSWKFYHASFLSFSVRLCENHNICVDGNTFSLQFSRIGTND